MFRIRRIKFVNLKKLTKSAANYHMARTLQLTKISTRMYKKNAIDALLFWDVAESQSPLGVVGVVARFSGRRSTVGGSHAYKIATMASAVEGLFTVLIWYSFVSCSRRCNYSTVLQPCRFCCRRLQALLQAWLQTVAGVLCSGRGTSPRLPRFHRPRWVSVSAAVGVWGCPSVRGVTERVPQSCYWKVKSDQWSGRTSSAQPRHG